MQEDNSTFSPSPAIVRNGTLVVWGYGIKVFVRNGFLWINYGLGRDRLEGRFNKATCNIERVVILGQRGMITLDAFKWLYEIGAGLIQIGWNGEIFQSAAVRKEHVSLKRRQYQAPNNETGLKITRYLLKEKLKGQRDVLKDFFPFAVHSYKNVTYLSQDLIKTLSGYLDLVSSIPEAIEIESLAAVAYFAALYDLELRFKKRDNNKVPVHWKTFGPRRSLLHTQSNRHATNPANAMLNYLYALLCAETRIKILESGLDPWAGIFHADNRYRESLIYDLMEPGRPYADRWLINYLHKNKLEKRYFHETPRGQVRLTLRLTPSLTETINAWGEIVNPFVWQVRDMLMSGDQLDRQLTNSP